ncbi:MAG: exodeoxyribonuclease VII small subunit [Candidatus Margulisbacteria bacterium]|nr:exodeoxyribonuclease VII small subunit [Candidatus Margulisiibacteriota bacterium]
MTLQTEIHTLESMIDELENPDLDLNDAVDLYAKAIKSANIVLKTFKKTEQKLEILQTEAGALLNQIEPPPNG